MDSEFLLLGVEGHPEVCRFRSIVFSNYIGYVLVVTEGNREEIHVIVGVEAQVFLCSSITVSIVSDFYSFGYRSDNLPGRKSPVYIIQISILPIWIVFLKL